MKKFVFSIIALFILFLFNAVNANAGQIALYTSYIQITGSRGLTKNIEIIASHKIKAEIVFYHSSNFKNKFNSFIKKVKYIFNQYGGFAYIQTFQPNYSPYRNVLISLPYMYNHKLYVEDLFVFPNGTYSINKKFKNMFGRYIKIRKTEKNLHITQFRTDYIIVSIKPKIDFGLTLISANSKAVGAYMPNISSYFVHNEYNEKSKKYFKYLINKWTKAEKKFLRS